MCPVKAWFENLIEIDGGHVILGNNKISKVLGIGTIRLKMFNDTEYLFQNIRYIPKLKKELDFIKNLR